MDQITINPNECIICRQWVAVPLFVPVENELKAGTTSTSEFYEDEKTLRRLFHLNAESCDETVKEAEIDEPEGAVWYCQPCSDRNYAIRNLFIELDRLNQSLEQLKETVENDFRHSFSLPTEGNLNNGFKKSKLKRQEIDYERTVLSQKFLERKKSVRYEIAKGLSLIQESGTPGVGALDNCTWNVEDTKPENLSTKPLIGSEATANRKQSRPRTRFSYLRLKKRHNLKELSISVKKLHPDILSELPVQISSFPVLKIETAKSRRSKLQNKKVSEEEEIEQEFAPIEASSISEEEWKNDSSDEDGPTSGVNIERCRKNKATAPSVQYANPRLYCPVDCCKRKMPFMNEADMEAHKMKFHEGVHQPYKCTECDRWFSAVRSRRVHFNAVHLKIKKQVCEHCGKGFYEKSNLTDHLRTHTGEKPWACPHCKSSFTTNSRMNRHIKYVHMDERPFKCDRCGKGFVEAVKMRAHIQTVHFGHERPFICEICGKTFPIHAYLHMHKIGAHKSETKAEPEQAEPGAHSTKPLPAKKKARKLSNKPFSNIPEDDVNVDNIPKTSGTILDAGAENSARQLTKSLRAESSGPKFLSGPSMPHDLSAYSLPSFLSSSYESEEPVPAPAPISPQLLNPCQKLVPPKDSVSDLS